MLFLFLSQGYLLVCLRVSLIKLSRHYLRSHRNLVLFFIVKYVFVIAADAHIVSGVLSLPYIIVINHFSYVYARFFRIVEDLGSLHLEVVLVILEALLEFFFQIVVVIAFQSVSVLALNQTLSVFLFAYESAVAFFVA